MSRCRVCQGRGRIRLPLYSEPKLYPEPKFDITIDLEDSQKEFPCPECAPLIPEESIRHYRAVSTIDDFEMMVVGDTNRFVQSVLRNLATQIADEILRSGACCTRTDKKGPTHTNICLDVYALDSKYAKSFEDRVKEHQSLVAEKVANKAIEKINHWGSYYNDVSITKEQAMRFIKEALDQIDER